MSSILSDYQYYLPPELIADRPTVKREESRMMVIDRKNEDIKHVHFSDITGFFSSQDLLVLNDTKVIPARLHDSTGKIEMLLLEQRDPFHWTAMVKPGKKMRQGISVQTAGTIATVREVFEDGIRLLEFEATPDLDRYGAMPIPPYFHRMADGHDRERYQTVYARKSGSVAAPTAGLHFTQNILKSLPHSFLTLQVGAGTFRPVQRVELSDHKMHAEHYTLPDSTAQRINHTTKLGGRIVAVGTTTTRVLESQPPGPLMGLSSSTDIFIRPPYKFQRVDSLLTNFHLPLSTLFMLVCAFAGREMMLSAYEKAVQERYRFFSYGDCMLIL